MCRGSAGTWVAIKIPTDMAPQDELTRTTTKGIARQVVLNDEMKLFRDLRHPNLVQCVIDPPTRNEC